MMHHPNMHHQPMSGHPQQHLGGHQGHQGHQGMPGHHQMPPHQMHRENRHPPMPRVAMGPSATGGGMGGHGGAMGALGSMGVHHGPGGRTGHPIRPMHHPPTQHHNVPPMQKPMRRPYGMGGGYSPGVMYQPPPHAPQPALTERHSLFRPSSPTFTTTQKKKSDFGASTNSVAPSVAPEGGGGEAAPTGGEGAESREAPPPATAAAAAAAAAAVANSKEKTPMCLVNELARYNKIKHQYRLTSETGPAHKKVFTVTLRLGDTEEYTAEGSSIKRAQHAAALAALGGTRCPAPPPRRAPPHPAADTRAHHGTVMPTVELNALAMKLCQPAIYTSIPPLVTGAGAGLRARGRGDGAWRAAWPGRGAGPATGLIYRVRVCVGAQAWLGEGSTPQAARHDAAARALHDLRPADAPPAAAAAAAAATAANNAANDDGTETTEGDTAGENGELLSSEVKSPVSLVHELALKRNLSVVFTVQSERGPPHMRVFITACTVGDMTTEGEGNGKKVSKRRAAEKMLEEMRRRWPPALLRARPQPPPKRKPPNNKKKPRNLIKESTSGSGESPNGEAADNPISRLAQARHAARARSPQYSVIEERGAARRREFIVRCDAPPHRAVGSGPNKKTAKRRAAHNVLVAMELGTTATEAGTAAAAAAGAGGAHSAGDAAPADPAPEAKLKEGAAAGGGGGGGGDARQPVPGVLMMDYQPRPDTDNGVSESGANCPGAKEQLMYLSQLLGFTVQFSDFPKRNHGSYLSLVSLSTRPPVMCHGAGASTALSHEQCARAALRAIALMGLDTVPATGAKPAAVSNGVTE